MNFSYDRRRSPIFNPMHHTFANYCTDTMQKADLHRDFGDEIFLNNLHLIPDPLKKNLADTLITTEKPAKPVKNREEIPKMPKEEVKDMSSSALSGILSFFSGVFNSLSGAMFRPKSPVYYDCFASDNDWQQSKFEQDKIGAVSSPALTGAASEMSSDCRTVASCEGKLNQVRYMLTPKPTNSVWIRRRPKKVFVEPGSVEERFEDAFSPEDFVSMPNQTFIECYSPFTYQNQDLCETGALKTKTEQPLRENTDIVSIIDKDVPEDCSLKDKSNLEMKNDKLILENQFLNMENENLKLESVNLQTARDSFQLEKESLNLELTKDNQSENKSKQNLISKIETQNSNSQNLCMEKQKSNSNLEKFKSNLGKLNTTEESIQNTDKSIDEVDFITTDKQQLISSCEDKLSKLKALLCKTRKPIKTISTETEVSRIKTLNSADKHYKNPHRTTDKRKKSKIKKHINDDMLFANEIDSETIVDESPSNSLTPTCLGDYFDEVTGRFGTASTTDSDDSFQIVFNDTPRVRIPSECESEDSFIVFEDSPDSCYTSNDVFGESDSETDSEVSDSGCSTLTCKLSHSLSRTVSNLTDDSLYAESGDEIDSSNIEKVMKCDEVVNKTGLLIDDEKKLHRRDQPVKKVHFSNDPPKVHLMRVWAFAARQARAGHWERYAVDRERFKRRIADVDMAVSWVLKPQHRSRVMFQRFMPWWHAQRRRELAEKKQRDEEEREKQQELERRELAEKEVEEEVRQEKLITASEGPLTKVETSLTEAERSLTEGELPLTEAESPLMEAERPLTEAENKRQ